MTQEKISDKEFDRIAHWQKAKSSWIAKKTKCPDSIGILLGSVIEKVAPKQKQFSKIESLWNEVLPAEMAGHSKVLELKGSTLKIRVESPSWLYSFQLHNAEMIGKLRQTGAGKKISRIKYEL